MTVQITIIGLGQIGASIGLALTERSASIKRVGHDRDPEVARKAKSLGAVDETNFNLPASIDNADIVILCLPLHEIEETLKIILPDLREGSVVMDTAPIKTPVANWFKMYSKQECHYIGLVPVLGPAHLGDPGAGIDAAKPDLFRKGMLGIVSPPGTPSKAIQLASDLSGLVGARPFYIDMAESDSLMTTVHFLPQVMATALLNSTVNQPGWDEGRKLAGRAYSASTEIVEDYDEPEAIIQGMMLNKENALRALDTAIVSLQRLREAVNKDDKDDLARRLEHAREGRTRWWGERQAANWGEGDEEGKQLDNLPDMWERFFGTMGKRRS